MLQADGRGLRHPRFRYWLLNTLLRRRALGARVGFWRQVPDGQDLAIDMLVKEKKRSLVRKMIGVTQAVPGVKRVSRNPRGGNKMFLVDNSFTKPPRGKWF